MNGSLEDDVRALVAALQPARCLAVGDEAAGILAHGNAPGCHLRAVPDGAALATLPMTEHFDFALVAGVLEHMAHRDGEVMLQKLRDLYTARFLLAIPVAAEGVAGDRAEPAGDWSRNELLAFGLVQIGIYDEAGGHIGLFSFDIDRYKHTPDWLNARNWANPELWDRYRW